MLFKDVTPTCKNVHQTKRKAEKSVTVDSSQADISRSSPSVETAKHAERQLLGQPAAREAVETGKVKRTDNSTMPTFPHIEAWQDGSEQHLEVCSSTLSNLEARAE